MNLPTVLANLADAQNNFDSAAYANCFSDNAVVFDEGKTYRGTRQISQWIEKANKEYQTKMKPLDYSEQEQVLKAEVSGNFPGSPVILSYHVALNHDLIESLRITL